MIPSLLTEWIDIYSRTKVKDEFGILQEVWTIFTRLKTKPVNRRSYEKVINEQVLPTDVTSFQIRYSRTIDETMILVYYGKVFDIRSLEHIKRTDTTITVERSKLALSDITPVSFDVTFEANVGGTSDPLGVVPANKGDIIPYNAIPEDLYEFSHWVVDGVDSPEQLNYIQVVKASVLTPVFTLIV